MKKMVYFLMGNLVPQVILAGLFLWVAAVVEKNVFANLTLLDSIYQGLLILILFGMDKAMERFGFTETSPYYAERLLAAASVLSVGIGLFLSMVYFSLGYFVIITPPAGLQASWVYALIVSAVLAAVYQMTISYEYIHSRIMAFTVLKCVKALIFTAVLTIVVFADLSVILGKIAADFISCLLPLVVLFILARRLLPHMNFRLGIVREALIYSAPFLVALLASFSLNHVDRFFIAFYLDLDSLANYGLSQRVVGVVTVVCSSIALVVPPLFYKSVKSDPSKVFRAMSEVMVICFWICVISACILPVIISLTYGEKYAEAVSYIPLLLTGVYFAVAVSCSTVLCLLLEKRSVLNMTTGLIAALMSIGLNYFCLPVIGVYGSILAYVVSMGCLYLIQYYIARSRFPELPSYFRQSFLLATLCLIISCLWSIDFPPVQQLMTGLIILAIVSIIYMFYWARNATILHVL